MDDLRFSRPVATAERLGAHAEDRHRFVDKRALVTGESGVLATANGRECLLASLRLLIRICPHVTVALPDDSTVLLDEVRSTIDPLAFGAPVMYQLGLADPAQFDATLCVGTTARPELPWTVINSNGWLARVSSGPTALGPDCGQRNPIGALAAASLGVTEVFKRLVRLKQDRGELLDGVCFNLYSYSTDESDAGPPLPELLPLNVLVVGAGAIGNGIVYLLTRLPVSGPVWIVDRQTFGDENLGTCILIGPDDVGAAKARFAETLLRPGLDAKGFSEDLTDFIQRLGSELPYPAVVLGGVDNIEARHEIQNLWPDLAIDGAIGDFMCEVSRHPWDEDVACLMCQFRQPPGRAAERVASHATGLSPSRTQEAEDTVSEADVRAAPSERQAWLRDHIGRPICSVVQEAVAQQLSDQRQREGFEPSVPFVACLSASMVVGELVKTATGWGSPLAQRFQFDVLRGPACGLALGQVRRPDCICVTRRGNIKKVRRRRSTDARLRRSADE